MVFVAQIFSIIVSSSVFISPAGGDDTMEALKTCSKVSNNASRLACYDSLLRTDAAKAEETPKSEFGLNTSRPSPLKSSLKRPTKPEMTPSPPNDPHTSEEPSTLKKILNTFAKKEADVTSANYEIVSHKKASNGAYIFTMKDGSVWKQTDSMRRPLRNEGFAASISKGSFGSYILKPEKGSWSVRVKRIK